MENCEHYDEHNVHMEEIDPRAQSAQMLIDGVVSKVDGSADNKNTYPPQ